MCIIAHVLSSAREQEQIGESCNKVFDCCTPIFAILNGKYMKKSLWIMSSNASSDICPIFFTFKVFTAITIWLLFMHSMHQLSFRSALQSRSLLQKRKYFLLSSRRNFCFLASSKDDVSPTKKLPMHQVFFSDHPRGPSFFSKALKNWTFNAVFFYLRLFLHRLQFGR